MDQARHPNSGSFLIHPLPGHYAINVLSKETSHSFYIEKLTDVDHFNTYRMSSVLTLIVPLACVDSLERQIVNVSGHYCKTRRTVACLKTAISRLATP